MVAPASSGLAARRFTCRICGKDVADGTEIFDVSRKKERGFIWAHFTCVVSGKRRPPCRHWVRRGTCAFGPSCFFAHPPPAHAVDAGGDGASTASTKGQDPQPTSHPHGDDSRVAAGRRPARHHDKPTHHQHPPHAPQTAAMLTADPSQGSWIATSGGVASPRSATAVLKGSGASTEQGVAAVAVRPPSKCGRSGHFRRFLLATFGRDRLLAGAGVLDVAGGKGELAFELINLHGIPATVIEPRGLRLDGAVKRFTAQIDWHNPVLSAGLIAPRPAPTFPAHLRVLFDAHLLDWVARVTESGRSDAVEGDLQRWLIEAHARALATPLSAGHEAGYSNAAVAVVRPSGTVLQSTESDDLEVTREAVEVATPDSEGDGQLVTSALEALRLLGDSSCVVGMHPDQATEAVIDFALAHNTAFAVVPCCVHPTEFPHRVRKDGTGLVRQYDDFVLYLEEKDPRINRATLPISGRSTVLWFDPEPPSCEGDALGLVVPEAAKTASQGCLITQLVVAEVERRRQQTCKAHHTEESVRVPE